MLKKIGKMILQYKRYIIWGIVMLVFCLIAKYALSKEVLEFDIVVYKFLVNCRTTLLNQIFKVITFLGADKVVITITILCMIFIKRKKYKLTIPINVFVIFLINTILKYIFQRPRPNELRLIEETGFSFPSGHSMVSMAFYGYFIYLIYKNVENVKLRNTICILLSILILLIGASRIYLGVHYASDVIAGICFSIAYLIFMISIKAYK